MSRRLPPLTALRAFEVAARTASFTAAAEELGVTHGAVSRQIHILEQWLGQRLFVRSGQRMVATPHGRAFAMEISRGFDVLSDAARHFGSPDAPRILQVNAPATFAMRWLIPRLPRFQAQNPSVEIRVSTSTTLTENQRSRFDIAIRKGPPQWPQYAATRFLDETDTLVASPALLERQPLASLDALRHHTMLAMESRPGDWADWLAAANYQQDWPLQRHRFDHYFVTLQAALDGFGLAIGAFPLLAADVDSGRLLTPFPDITVARPSYYLLVPFDADKSKALRDFQRWIVAEGEAANGTMQR